MTPPEIDLNNELEWRQWVMEKFIAQEKMLGDIRGDIKALNVKAGIWGGVTGLVAALAAHFGIKL